MLIRVHGLRELRINSEFQPYRGSVRFPLPSAVRLLVLWFQCCHAWPKIVLGRVVSARRRPPRVPGQFQLSVRTRVGQRSSVTDQSPGAAGALAAVSFRLELLDVLPRHVVQYELRVVVDLGQSRSVGQVLMPSTSRR